jgi:uncharacterized protein
MAVLLEGIGDDWVVMRREGGSPELLTFSSMSDFRAQATRMLAKAEQTRSVKRTPVKLPQASQAPPPPPLSAVIGAAKPTVFREPEKRQKKQYPPLPDDADCRKCGACCGPRDQRKDTHAALEPEDVANIPSVMRKTLIVRDGGHPYIKTKKNADGHTVCAALSGSIGKSCKCGIYSKRPMVCVIFEKGSEECLAARASFGV